VRRRCRPALTTPTPPTPDADVPGPVLARPRDHLAWRPPDQRPDLRQAGLSLTGLTVCLAGAHLAWCPRAPASAWIGNHPLRRSSALAFVWLGIHRPGVHRARRSVRPDAHPTQRSPDLASSARRSPSWPSSGQTLTWPSHLAQRPPNPASRPSVRLAQRFIRPGEFIRPSGSSDPASAGLASTRPSSAGHRPPSRRPAPAIARQATVSRPSLAWPSPRPVLARLAIVSPAGTPPGRRPPTSALADPPPPTHRRHRPSCHAASSSGAFRSPQPPPASIHSQPLHGRLNLRTTLRATRGPIYRPEPSGDA
jgi:hypothetical protein